MQTVELFSRRWWTTRTIFGAVAAANALSDVCAMGGGPIVRHSPFFLAKGDESDHRNPERRRGEDREASCSILGGRGVSPMKLKFGYAVTGLVVRTAWEKSDAATY